MGIDAWSGLWQAVLWFSMASYALLTVVVSIGALRDLKDLRKASEKN